MLRDMVGLAVEGLEDMVGLVGLEEMVGLEDVV